MPGAPHKKARISIEIRAFQINLTATYVPPGVAPGTDTGKFLFTWEQRFRVISREIFGIPCEFWIDPFVEVGGVFHHFDNIGQSKFRGDGVLGFCFVVPPNVIARIDVAAGDEDYNVYTQLNYPF